MKTTDLKAIFESLTSYPVLTKDSNGANACVQYTLAENLWDEPLKELGSFKELDSQDADRILDNIDPKDKPSVLRGKVYANDDQTIIAIAYGEVYQVAKEYDGGYSDSLGLYDTEEEALGVLEYEARKIAEISDSERKEWIADSTELENLLEESIEDGAEQWARNYQAIKDKFQPGLWQTDWRYDPELIYAKGNDTLSWDNYRITIKLL